MLNCCGDQKKWKTCESHGFGELCLDRLGIFGKYHWYRLVCSFALIWLWRCDDGFWWKRLYVLNWFWLDFRRLESVKLPDFSLRMKEIRW